MTIVCAITDGATTWIGSDRQMTMGGSLAIPCRQGKWSELPSGWWVGVSGWVRLENLVQQCTHTSYDAAGLAQRVRELIRADGWQKAGPAETLEGPEQHDVSMLLAKPGELWAVLACSAAVRCPDQELAAIGAGSAAALGAAWAYMRFGVAVSAEVIETAVLASCRYEPSCGHGEWIRKLKPKGERT